MSQPASDATAAAYRRKTYAKLIIFVILMLIVWLQPKVQTWLENRKAGGSGGSNVTANNDSASSNTAQIPSNRSKVVIKDVDEPVVAEVDRTDSETSTPPVIATPSSSVSKSDSTSEADAKTAADAKSETEAKSATVATEKSKSTKSKSSKKKNLCRLIEFEGQGHGFFNFNLSFEMYEATLMAMDELFVELGFLEPDPDSGLGKMD